MSKWNTRKCFDSEVLEKLNVTDKFLTKFKKPWFNKKSDLCKKKQVIFGEKLSETVGKPKELWESPKSPGMPNKTVISTFNAIKDSNILTYDTPSI